TSVPPWMKSPPSSSATSDGRRSSTLLLLPLPLRGLPPRAQHLLAGDRQLVHVGAGRVADRVRDRRGDRDYRRLAESFRAKIGQVLVGPVDELAQDLRHV